MQQKQRILEGKKMADIGNEYVIDKAYAQAPFLLRERITVHLHDKDMNIRFHGFFKKYVPQIIDMPFKWNSAIDIHLVSNDRVFHEELRRDVKKVYRHYF